MSAESSVPCDARFWDGVVRGGMVGALWAGFFGPSELHAERLRSGRPVRLGAFAARYGLLASAGFAGLNGAYNALFCYGERVFGDGVAGACVAGGVAGGVIGACYPGLPPPRSMNVAVCSVGTAVLCAASFRLVRLKKDG